MLCLFKVSLKVVTIVTKLGVRQDFRREEYHYIGKKALTQKCADFFYIMMFLYVFL